jgi:hypothetical protein
MANDVSIKFTADVQEALRKISGFSEQSAASMKKLEDSVGLMRRAGEALAGVFVFDKIRDGFTTVIHAAADSEDKFESMRSALKASGDYSDRAAAQFVKLADRIQKTTKYDDDVVLGQVAIAKSFQTTNSEAAKLIEAAVQLSAVTRDTLDASVEQLGKTLDGTAGRLAETLPDLRRFSEEQLRAGAALDYVKARFKGTAEAQTNTFQGALQQTQNSYQNVIEKMGEFITKNETVIHGLKAATSFFDRLASDNGLQSMVAAIAGGVAGLAAFAGGFAAWIVVVKAATFAAAQFGITMTAALGPIGLLAAAITALGAAAAYMATKEKEVKSSTQVLNEELAAAQKSVENLQESIRRSRDADYTRAVLVPNLAKAEEKLAALQEHMNKVRVHTSLAAKSTKDLGDGFDDAGKKGRRFSDEIKTQVASLLKHAREIGLTEEQKLNEAYRQQAAVLEKARANGQVSMRDYLFAYYKLNTQLEMDLHELRKKQAEELLQKQADRFKAFFSEPVKFLLDKTATMKDGLAAGLGAFAQILAGGTTASADARRNFDDGKTTIKSQLDQGIASLDSDVAKQRADVEKRLAARVIDERMAQEELTKIQEEYNSKRADLQVKYNQDLVKAEQDYQKALKEAKKQEVASTAKVIGAGLATAANAFMPGLGEAVGPLFEALAKGPDAVKEMIQGFIRAIPDVLKNVVQAIPAVMKTIIEEIPAFIDALVEAAPDIIEALALGMPDVIAKLVEKAPEIIWKMQTAAPKVIIAMAERAGVFIKKLVDGAGEFIGKIAEGAFSFVGTIVEGAASFVGQILQGAVNFIGEIINGAGRFVQAIIDKINPFGGGGGFGLGGDRGLLGGGIIPGFLKGGVNLSGKGGSESSGIGAINPNVGRTMELAAIGEKYGYGLHGARNDTLIRQEMYRQGWRKGGASEDSPASVQGSSGEPIVIQINVGEAQLARVMTNLNRRGFRTA